jgi:hypothetical protein
MKRRAKRLMSRKFSRDDGSILQFVVWKLLEPLPGSGHRHYGDREEPYIFRDLDTLLGDFLDDVAQFER